MSKRALRRHHRARMIARARHVTRRWHGSYEPEQLRHVPGRGYVFVPRPSDHQAADAQATRLAEHLKVCSATFCGCGNPRRQKGFHGSPLTLQEKRADLYMEEWREDID